MIGSEAINGAESNLNEYVRRNSLEHALLKALRRAPLRAINHRKHRATIRELPDWADTVMLVTRRGYVPPVARPIADALVATAFWRRKVIPMDSGSTPPVRVPSESFPGPSGETEIPFGARFLSSAFRRAEMDHQAFKRKGASILKSVECFQAFVKTCDDHSNGFLSYGPVLAASEQLAGQIRTLTQIKPCLHGTELEANDESAPHNVAAAIVYKILLGAGEKKFAALQSCYRLLHITFPDQFPTGRKAQGDDGLYRVDGLYQRILRVRRKWGTLQDEKRPSA